MSIQSNVRRLLPLAWILPGAACAAFMVGNQTAPVMAWLAALFTLRFVRTMPAARGVVIGLVAWALAYVLGWRGVLPFHGWMAWAIPAMTGMAAFCPFIIDRFLAPRLGRWLGWLVLPTTWVVVELGLGKLGFGTWGAVAYSQFGALSLLQVLSVVGMAGPAFLIAGFASAANAVWENPTKGRAVALTYGGVLALVLVVGGLRIAFAPLPEQTVRVAGVVVDHMAVFRDSWGPLSYGKTLSDDAAQRVRPAANALLATLFERSAQAAEAGADIIVWSEANALVFEEDEPAMLRAGQAFAAGRRVHLFMAAAVMRPGAPLAENVIIVIDDQGRIVDRYLKSHPTPGEASRPGDGRMRTLDTRHGRLAWAICYDFDYPDLIRQASRAGADILIDPSWEHKGMAPLHSHMAALRAVETGTSLFRPVNGGLSLAVDPYGRVLASQPPSAAARDFVADLPVQGARTMQSFIGDAFGWGCCVLLLVLGALAARGRYGKRPECE